MCRLLRYICIYLYISAKGELLTAGPSGRARCEGRDSPGQSDALRTCQTISVCTTRVLSDSISVVI
jgi:hypothetical protein